MQKLGALIATEPDVDNVVYWINPSPSASVGQVQINLKPFGSRTSTAAQVVARVKKAAGSIEGLTLALQVRQDIQIGGRSGAAQYQYTLQDGDTVAIGGPFVPHGAGDAPSRRAVFVCHPTSAADENPCARKILSRLARRAYRRQPQR